MFYFHICQTYELIFEWQIIPSLWHLVPEEKFEFDGDLELEPVVLGKYFLREMEKINPSFNN